ncbi:hypothetical protein FMM05_00010 [Flavobacterium zepuense]|uniref:Lipoprotein n=1 Tax=Flavobacterium zepuense TaxID=2593302 RepID=A0A552V9F5_9FLAO|nr:hypothetical protein [Flavobacterium zepuense]TRW27069.1 hypothetical protein FMM05_00010 [Flavobacterium zepuense]
MKTLITLIMLVAFCSCTKHKEEIELKLENDTIIACSNENCGIVNIIKYSITNNSDNFYYINNICIDKGVFKRAIYSDGVNLQIYNQFDKEIKYNSNTNYPKKENNIYSYLIENASILEKSLDYDNQVGFYRNFGYKNFYIYPGETIYFEYSLNLNSTVGYEAVRVGLISLDKREDYKATVSISSDSTNYKNILPRDILKTIKTNKVKVYHGIIESNKVPIKVL